jgi:hypothetical protein
MGLFRKTDAEKTAIAEMRAADAELHAYSRELKRQGIRVETDEFIRLNDEANAKANKVSRWRGGNR